MQRPGADAAEQEGGAELRLAALGVRDVAVGAVEGQRADGGAGVDHARDRVVPGVLLVAGAGGVGVVRVGIGDRTVAGVPAADAGGLHAARGGEVGGAEGHALDARGGAGDLLEVGDALGGLEHAVHQDRALQARLRLELGEQAVGVVDVPGTLDLGDHDHLELVPDLSHELGDVVEEVGRGELVDTRPQRGFAKVHLTARP